MEPLPGTVVEHVRLCNAQTDVPVARLRLSYLLSSIDLRPDAMPPSAVLIIRSMRDPLPQRITSEFVSAAIPSRAWECAAQSQMGEFYSRAARPAAEPVSTSAESVLFNDYAELLACLALDIDKSTANFWWWQSILRRFSTRGLTDWAEVWAEHPRYIPAALHHLDRHGCAVEMVERISSTQAWDLLIAVAREFSLPASLISAIEDRKHEAYFDAGTTLSSRATKPGPFADTSSDAQQASADAGPSSPLEYSFSTTMPWEPWVRISSVPASLRKAQRALLGVSLLLHTTPAAAFGASFALRFCAWLADEQARDGQDDRKHPASAFHCEAAKAKAETRLDGDGEFFSAPASDLNRAEAIASNPLPSTAQTKFDTASALEPVEAIQLRTRSRPLPTPAEFGAGKRTSLVGIFYLIHVLLQAEFLHFDTGLSGWALLDLLARCLLGQRFTSHADDPVWAALAALDGREADTPPGASFRPQKIYEAPDAWLIESERSNSRYVRLRQERTEIWHLESFIIFDSEGPTPPLPSGLHPLTRHRRQRFRSAAQVNPVGIALSPQLRRFLHFILPYVRWRLRAALGEASPLEVMSGAGTLYVTATHVDLVMGMDQISLPARVAGLDANPGWVFQLGRVITFHFIQEGFDNG